MDARLPFLPMPAAVQSLGAWMAKPKHSRQKDDVHGSIERYLTANDIPRPEKVHEEDGRHYLLLGSALGRVGFIESDGDLYLHADAVVMKKLPSDQDLMVPLIRELLEPDAGLAESVRPCIAGDTVLVMAHRWLTDLSETDVRESIETVMALAYGLDDGFAAKYSGTSRRRGA